MAECGDKCALEGRKIDMITQDGCDFCIEARKALQPQLEKGLIVEKSLSKMPEKEFGEFVNKYGKIAEGTPLFIINDKKQCDLTGYDKPSLKCDDGSEEML